MDLTKPNEADKKPDSLAFANKLVSITEPSLSPKSPTVLFTDNNPTPSNSEDPTTTTMTTTALAQQPKTPEESRQKHLNTPTINEENEIDDTNNLKSCLSLPVELPPSGLPPDTIRRKLSVQGLMAFAERRRSSSTFSEMRKLSITNGDAVNIRAPGGVGEWRGLSSYGLRAKSNTLLQYCFLFWPQQHPVVCRQGRGLHRR